MSAALRTLDDVLEKQGWDQPASLWSFSRSHVGEEFILEARMVLGGAAFQQGHPTDVLAAVADAAQTRRLPVGDDLVAFVFATEAWTVVASVDDEREMMEQAADRRIHTHPDRVEVRMLSAVDRAGFRYEHSYARGSGERTEGVYRAGEQGGGMVLEGDAYESLERLVEACA